jgi:hypothetical protein
MYVMSTLPPSQQSIAGGIFNTVNKLCSTLGLGIATSVQSSVALRMTASSPAIQPYLSVYWFAAAASGLSLVLVPFLTIGKQGNSVPQNDQLISGEEAGEKTAVTANTSSVVSSAADITEHQRG